MMNFDPYGMHRNSYSSKVLMLNYYKSKGIVNASIRCVSQYANANCDPAEFTIHIELKQK